MRVVHAIRSNGFAGVERHVARLASAQAAHGDQVHVIGGHHLKMPQALEGSGVDYSRGDNLRELIRSAGRLIGDADVMHVHMTAAELGVALVSWCRRAMPPLVTTRHFPLQRGRRRSVRAIAALAASRLKAQIAISKYVAERVEGQSTIVYPGVDIQPDARPATEREPVVLVVQRLEPEKDTEVAIAAFAESRLAEHGWRLDIAGDGSLRSDLADLAARNGVSDAVRFLGSRDDVPKLMADSSMLIAPCAVEGLGLSVLEAMAAGLPTVACAIGGHLETLPAAGHSVCFPASDASAAASAILRLAGNPDLCNHLAAAGQQRQRALFTLDTQVTGTNEVYWAAMRY
jgi:glycosyltransferase involved in cell wall biosynthesis